MMSQVIMEAKQDFNLTKVKKNKILKIMIIRKILNFRMMIFPAIMEQKWVINQAKEEKKMF